MPLGAGLSSSAAIECAVAVALNELWGLGLDRMALARAGRLAENVAVGAPTGIMDQCASLLGEADHAVFLDCATEIADSVPLHLDREGLTVLVIDTHGAPRSRNRGLRRPASVVRASRRATQRAVAAVC